MSNNARDTDDTPVLLTGVYMLVFYVIYLLVGYVLFAIGVAQLLVKLLSGEPQSDLRRFGAALSCYMSQIVDYIAMRSPVRPFPFSDWPRVQEREEKT